MALYKYFKKEGDCNSAFITTRETEKADEKVKQVLDALMHGYNNSKTANVDVPLQYNIPIQDIS